MDKGLLVKKSIFVNADEVTVWDALVNPKKIKEYLFGTDTVSDWKVGSRITYKGVWQGDKPENYATVTYELAKKEGGTLVSLTQDNCKTEEQKKHLEENWGMVLEGLKKVAEGK